MTGGVWLHADTIFLKAVFAWCTPVHFLGEYGPAWHCGCKDRVHALSGTSSLLTEWSIEAALRKHPELLQGRPEPPLMLPPY